MPRLPVPLPARSMVPVEEKPVTGGNSTPPLALVSISTPVALAVPVLAIKPLLVTELLELMVIVGLAAVMPTPPLAPMEMLPDVAVVSAVEVLVVISTSACAPVATASRAAAAAESIKRCLVNTTSLKSLRGGPVLRSAAMPQEGPLFEPAVPGQPAGNLPVCLVRSPHPQRGPKRGPFSAFVPGYGPGSTAIFAFAGLRQRGLHTPKTAIAGLIKGTLAPWSAKSRVKKA